MWKLPIVGWLLSGVAAVSSAIPFWICWTVCGIGQTYFYWLPAVYLSIPFWPCVGLFVCISILGYQVRALMPKLASVSQTVTPEKDKQVK